MRRFYQPWQKREYLLASEIDAQQCTVETC
jgi:hypothetical protein